MLRVFRVFITPTASQRGWDFCGGSRWRKLKFKWELLTKSVSNNLVRFLDGAGCLLQMIVCPRCESADGTNQHEVSDGDVPGGSPATTGEAPVPPGLKWSDVGLNTYPHICPSGMVIITVYQTGKD